MSKLANERERPLPVDARSRTGSTFLEKIGALADGVRVVLQILCDLHRHTDAYNAHE